MIGGGDTLPLRSRGYIGDTASGALVAADGTIDWFCPRRFDAPPSFYRLLDPEGGAVRVAPAGSPRAGRQSYEDGTNVLTTVLSGAGGELEVVDLMPWEPGATPPGRIVRALVARRGPVVVDVDVVPGAAWRPARRVHPFSGGIAFDGIVVRTPAPVEGRRARFTLETGERAVVTVDVEGDQRTHEPLSPDRAFDIAARTARAWRSYVAPTTYDGPYERAVERSLLVLGGLTAGRHGAVVAAPTTSLPTRIGGERNWDYRHCWLRDSSMAVNVLYDTGLGEAAAGFGDWVGAVLADATHPLSPVYATDGSPVPVEEREVPVRGWRGSQPVREHNAAAAQVQLDMYAELFCIVHERMLGTDHPLLAAWDGFARAADWLGDNWHQPDSGVWELRCEPRQLIDSKVNSWFALDHLGRLGQRRHPLDLAPAGWRLAAADVLAWLEDNAIAPQRYLRHDAAATAEPDASLLRVAWRGPWPIDHPVVEATVDRVLARLADGPFLFRYLDDVDDGLPPGEGAFLPASFWAVRALAALGRWEEAHARMDALVAFAEPVGLLPEQADPVTGDFLGNLPQAFTHLSLVEAALALANGPR